ncbi:MAG: competence/damage-inducible protein A [Gemmatimonadetes bacterium]|nr:competence/damage-inducible protein A [Gemmatimonadota bacterium]
MDLELVTIGTELLLGFTIDSNAAEIARALASVGARVVRRTTVGDDPAAITDAVRDGLARTGFVVTTGGLGPTRDDVSKRAVAALFGAPLVVDPVYLDQLRQRFQRLGRGPMPESNRTQAEIPRGAIVLPNQWGTAPGLWLQGEPGVAVLLPGVPREVRGLLEHEVGPRVQELVARLGGAPTVTLSRTLRTTGITESALADRIGPLEDRFAPVTLAYLPTVEGVDLRLTAWGLKRADAERVLGDAAEMLKPVLGEHCYGEDGCDLAAVVLARLERRGARLAVAESCTGGLLGGRITAVPGASRAFVGGVVAYTNDVKVSELGVPQALLEQHGAVSEPVVRAMAEEVTRRFGATAGLAVTGIAGPTGGTPEKPVGTVWLAAFLEGRCETALRRFPGDRQHIRQRSAQAALDLLRRMLQ